MRSEIMSKFLVSAVAAAFALGLTGASANDTSASPSSKSWKQFQSQVKKCEAMTGDQQKQCMANAKATYRASNFNCDTLSGQNKTQCEKYGAQWSSASQDTHVRTGEPNIAPTDPADPTDALKNRDSRKQEGNAASSLPEPQKQN